MSMYCNFYFMCKKKSICNSTCITNRKFRSQDISRYCIVMHRYFSYVTYEDIVKRMLDKSHAS